jgi:very-short-patch-repair endonuclease
MTPRSKVPSSPWKGEIGREAAGRGSRFSRTPKMTARARRLREGVTDAEQKLWRALRRNQLNGLNFRRQHPIGPYTLDFDCSKIRLGIGIDGGQHNSDVEIRKDTERSKWLASKGVAIIRFWNNDTLGNTEGVLAEIARVAQERSKTLTPSPALPLSGGGRKQAGL